ncbi:MAG TPA: GIY-YIG nuclease family protein [Patescibacteria group bacterium]|nr:GIY-YIG nuclease family protein [Patescibacteria group bacterium]
MNNQFYVYIMGSIKLVLYIGVTSNLVKRVFEHKNKLTDSFTAKYNVHKLLYYEICDTAEDAINREKQLKNWHRAWKINLIKSRNPQFKDLYQEIL